MSMGGVALGLGLLTSGASVYEASVQRRQNLKAIEMNKKMAEIKAHQAKIAQLDQAKKIQDHNLVTNISHGFSPASGTFKAIDLETNNTLNKNIDQIEFNELFNRYNASLARKQANIDFTGSVFRGFGDIARSGSDYYYYNRLEELD